MNTAAYLLALCFAATELPSDPPAPFTTARFREHAAYLAADALEGREPGTAGGIATTNYIAEQFAKLGLEPLGDNKTYFQGFPHNHRQARNVVGWLPGNGDLAGEHVIVMAHHDHLGVLDAAHPARKTNPNGDFILNGADDNASGVAALLLVAESLMRSKDTLPASRRGVIFLCTDAEEAGLLGARHYAAHPARPLDKAAYVLNFDMVGHLNRAKLYANDAESCPELAEVMRNIGNETGLPVETRIGSGNRSDQLIFLERSIPSAHLVTGMFAEYHQPEDEIDTLDLDGAARIAWLASQFIESVIEKPGPFVFRPIDPGFDVQHALALVGRLGMVPEVNAQDGRHPLIAFVVPLSPAAKAGLRAGDRITALNGQGFDRIEDVLIIFSKLKFDHGLLLTVQRGAERVDLRIPAEVFASLAGPTVRQVGDAYEVTFKFQAPKNAKSVYLAGTFNDWKPTGHKMDGPDASGRFTTTLKLIKGTHQYKFVVNGEDWHSDPTNIHQAGLYRNSVVWVGE